MDPQLFALVAGWASILGAGLGALGLLYSILAWVQARTAAGQATSAAAAAQAALEGVKARAVAEELQIAAALAERIFDFLRQEHFPEAQLRVGDLVGLLAELVNRRGAQLDPMSRGELAGINGQLDTLAGELARGNPTQANGRSLVAAARGVATRLRALLGRAKKSVD